MAENIKLRKRNFTVNEGYFYTIENDRDNLLQKTDDGNTAFSYPSIFSEYKQKMGSNIFGF